MTEEKVNYYKIGSVSFSELSEEQLNALQSEDFKKWFYKHHHFPSKNPPTEPPFMSSILQTFHKSTKLKYSLSIKWSKDDNCFIAFSKELRGMAAHGNTYEEAVKEFFIGVKGWLDVYVEQHNGEYPPVNYFKQDDLR